MANPKPPKIQLSPEEFAQVNEGAATSLTQDWSPVNQGLAGSIAEREQLLRDQPLEMAIADQKRSTWEIWQAGLQETETAYLLRAYLDERDDVFPRYDPNFDIKREYAGILAANGIEDNDDNLTALAKATSLEEASQIATSIADKEAREAVLSQHGVMAFATGAVDPLTVLVDVATFGGAKALKLGRLTSALAGGASATAVSAMADYAGKDYEALDYAINFGVTAGAFALVGGRGVNGLRASAGNPGVGTDATSRLTDFLSETDKLISPSPASAEVMAPIIDDPVRRAGLMTNDNAASTFRVNANLLDGTFAKWTESLEKTISQRESLGTFGIKMDIQGKYGEARDALERRVAEELARRDAEWTRFGSVAQTRVDPDVKRLADEYEAMMTQGAELAKRQGLAGFEDFAPRPGYFHRSWSESKIRQLEDQYGQKTVRGLLTESIVRGLNIPKKDAALISTAILTRTRTKAAGLRPEFMGALGKTDTDAIRTMLVEAGTDDSVVTSIMRRIEQNLDEAGKSKYSKTRLPLDMTVKMATPDGKTISVLDMIDTDLSRLADNYNQQMAGRSALAAAGVGGDDASIQALRGRYHETLVQAGLKDADIDDHMLQFDHLMSDFTGNRPPGTILGATAQRAKSLAHSTMLAASGLWQVAEYGTLAYRHGAARTAAEFFRQFPGVAGILRKAGRDPDLYDELTSVVGLDLARDVRVRPWLRQYEANLTASDTMLDRVLYLGNQATPILNGMKFVHTHQVRLNANLTMNTIGRAAAGDRRAVQMLREYGLDGDAWTKVKQAVLDNAEMNGKNVRSMNWDGWSQEAVDAALNVAARIMDDTILFGRAGQGSSFARSQVGQILGQFRSFVSFAHNKLLRGTIQNSGYTGLAMLLAYQYPLTMMMVAANELRKGEVPDFTSEEGLLDLSKKAIGYTAGIGFIGDAAGILGLTGGRGGLSAPVLGLANAPGSIIQGTGHLLQGEGSEAIADYMQAARTALPFVGVAPGTALLQNALKE